MHACRAQLFCQCISRVQLGAAAARQHRQPWVRPQAGVQKLECNCGAEKGTAGVEAQHALQRLGRPQGTEPAGGAQTVVIWHQPWHRAAAMPGASWGKTRPAPSALPGAAPVTYLAGQSCRKESASNPSAAVRAAAQAEKERRQDRQHACTHTLLQPRNTTAKPSRQPASARQH